MSSLCRLVVHSPKDSPFCCATIKVQITTPSDNRSPPFTHTTAVLLISYSSTVRHPRPSYPSSMALCFNSVSRARVSIRKSHRSRRTAWNPTQPPSRTRQPYAPTTWRRRARPVPERTHLPLLRRAQRVPRLSAQWASPQQVRQPPHHTHPIHLRYTTAQDRIKRPTVIGRLPATKDS